MSRGGRRREEEEYTKKKNEEEEEEREGKGDLKTSLILTKQPLKIKRNLPYIRNQSVPRSKHFPPRL